MSLPTSLHLCLALSAAFIGLAQAADEPAPAPNVTFTSDQAHYQKAFEKAQMVIQADMRNGQFLAGKNWAQVWTRDSSYSTDLSMNLLEPALCQSTLLGLTEDVPGIGVCWAQDKCGHFGRWPALTDSIVGATGAWSLYLATGDASQMKTYYSRTVNTLRRAERDAYDPKTGLFDGCSSFMESNSAYPKAYAWHGEMLAKTAALSTCALYYNGYLVAGLMADKLGEDGAPFRVKAAALKKAINHYFWQADKGYYGYFLDAHDHLIPQMEGLGEALCIQFGIASPERAKEILRSTPTTAQGLPCLWPQWPEYKDYTAEFAFYYHNGMIWPFVQGYWGRDAARVGDMSTFVGELDKLVALSEKSDTIYEFYFPEDGHPGGSPNQLWSASGYMAMVLNGLLGINVEEKGIRFTPMVPKTVHELKLSGLAYRGSTLSISIHGSGKHIASFTLDGKASATPFFDGTLTGPHEIAIDMK